MSQQLQATSQNLPNQLSKPQNSLITFVSNNQELEIVNAVEKSILIGNLKDWNEILKVVSKWRLWIGIPKNEIDTELTVATEFIGKTYPHLTLAEIELAYTLSISRKLEDVEFFGYFSPLYIGKVLDSYLYYRKMNMADAIRKRERYLQEQAEIQNRPSPEEQCKDTKEIMSGFYEKWKETGEVDDLLNICYNFLRKIKLLKLTQAEIEEAMQVAKKNKIMNPMAKIIVSDEFQNKVLARNYCVKKFFERTDISVILENIKPEQFI